tara:strand:+ start:220 stop:399 length:180 start_codon:yes stop_codon:yes gene_type:complete
MHEKSASILEKYASNIPDTINLPDFDRSSLSNYSNQNRSYEMNRSQNMVPKVADKVTMA